MKNNYIENTNRDLYLASRRNNSTGKVSVYMSPVIGWRIEEIETDDRPLFSLHPICIDYALGEDDYCEHAVYDKNTEEWYVHGWRDMNGNGEPELLNYLTSQQ